MLLQIADFFVSFCFNLGFNSFLIFVSFHLVLLFFKRRGSILVFLFILERSYLTIKLTKYIPTQEAIKTQSHRKNRKTLFQIWLEKEMEKNTKLDFYRSLERILGKF